MIQVPVLHQAAVSDSQGGVYGGDSY